MNPFDESHYNSNDGMMTYTWGPAMWHSLHTMSFNYPVNPTKEQKQEYYAFFMSLQWVLPCKYCRDNYKENLKKLPLDTKALKNRDSLSRWVYHLHNLVNKNLDKPITLTYEQVRDRYEHFRSRCLTTEEITESKEKGCTQPLRGEKCKLVLNIVPKIENVETFNMDERCKIKK